MFDSAYVLEVLDNLKLEEQTQEQRRLSQEQYFANLKGIFSQGKIYNLH